MNVEDGGDHRSLPVISLEADVANIDWILSTRNIEDRTPPVLTEPGH